MPEVPQREDIYTWKNSAKADQALTTIRFFQLPGVYTARNPLFSPSPIFDSSPVNSVQLCDIFFT